MKKQQLYTTPTYSIVAIALLSLFGVSFTHATESENFNNEVDFMFSSKETKKRNQESDSFNLSVRHYFETVESRTLPYNETNFFSRSSFLSFSMSESDEQQKVQSSTDQTAYSVVGTIAKPYLPYIFSAGYTYSQLEEKSVDGIKKTDEKDKFSLGAGYYVKHNILFSLQYSKSDLEEKLAELDTATATNNSYTAQVRWFNKLAGGKGISLTPRFEYERAQDKSQDLYTRSTGIDAQWYFDRATNIGFDYRRSLSDFRTEEGDTYTASFKRYITPKFSIGVSYSQFITDQTDLDDSEQFSFSATSRF